MFGRFSEKTQKVLTLMKNEMKTLRHSFIGSEHLILAILLEKDNEAYKLLEKYDVTYQGFKGEIIDKLGYGDSESELFLYTPLMKRVITNSIEEARSFQTTYVNTLHIMYALLLEGEGVALRVLLTMNVDLNELFTDISEKVLKIKKNKKTRPKLSIEDYTIDLCASAKAGILDPVIGREKEIDRTIEILLRRSKNNPVLVGEAGVGKTAIVEGIAIAIVNKQVPEALLNKKILSLSMATAIAGTKYRGEFEERMKDILDELSNRDDYILFIDELHTLVGAGGAEGAIDASNIFKPPLSRGLFQCIGATTFDEYTKYIERDKALDRRFQRVTILEPTTEVLLNILKELQPVYEKYHNVDIDEGVLKYIIKLSDKYIKQRYQPDKAIDLLDEACARVKIVSNKYPPRLVELEKDIKNIKRKKNQAVKDGDYEKAKEMISNEQKLISELNHLEEEFYSKKTSREHLTTDVVASVVSDSVNIPSEQITSKSDGAFIRIKENLKKDVYQPEAIDQIIESLENRKYNFDKGVQSYILHGPRNSGKTYLVERLCQEMFYNKDNLIKVDMSEYNDKISMTKLIGSSPGYIGYDDNNYLFEQIRRKNYCILLLENIDKCCFDVLNLVKQVIENSTYKDNKNNIVNFENVIIFMNYTTDSKGSLGFGNTNRVKADLNLDKGLLGLVDEVIELKKISNKNVLKIIDKEAEKYRLLNNEFIYEIASIEFEKVGIKGVRKELQKRLNQQK